MDAPPTTGQPEAITTRSVPSWVLLVFIFCTASVLVLVPASRTTAIGHVLEGSAWWENLNLFGILLLTTFAIMLWAGRLRLGDVGIRRDKIRQGVIVTLCVWAAMQLWPVIAAGSSEISSSWEQAGIGPMLRWTAVMFLATAFWEEIAFRGFLLPQLYLRIKGGHRFRLIAALLLSQLVFSAAHLPAHLMIRQLAGAELLQMFLLQAIAGLMLGLLYLRTRNLWIVIGIHGLANAPTALLGGALGWEIPLLFILLFWPRLSRNPAHQGLAHIIDIGSGSPAREAGGPDLRSVRS